MKSSIEKALDLAAQASATAKELALIIPRAITADHEGVHEKTLNMLLTCSQLETTLRTLQEREATVSRFASRPTDDRSPKEIETTEVMKVNKRLPRWARNPSQINSKILACYLRTAAKGGVVTEEALREAFVRSGENEDQFNKNFPQMKMISERNHGKVFEVIDGRVTIWPQAAEAVDVFKRIYQGER